MGKPSRLESEQAFGPCQFDSDTYLSPAFFSSAAAHGRPWHRTPTARGVCRRRAGPSRSTRGATSPGPRRVPLRQAPGKQYTIGVRRQVPSRLTGRSVPDRQQAVSSAVVAQMTRPRNGEEGSAGEPHREPHPDPHWTGGRKTRTHPVKVYDLHPVATQGGPEREQRRQRLPGHCSSRRDSYHRPNDRCDRPGAQHGCTKRLPIRLPF